MMIFKKCNLKITISSTSLLQGHMLKCRVYFSSILRVKCCSNSKKGYVYHLKLIYETRTIIRVCRVNVYLIKTFKVKLIDGFTLY